MCTCILRHASESDARNVSYQNSIYKVEVGNNIAFGNYALSGCGSLLSITIPYGISEIWQYAFQYCYSLSGIIIPDGVTDINSYAFSACLGLSIISIPNSITRIRVEMCTNCYALANLTISDSVTSISSYAFNNCFGLWAIKIPENTTSIAMYTFYACRTLSSITIPASVTSISKYAFYNCFGVKYYDFTVLEAVPSLGDVNAFTGIAADCEIRVPAALADEWKAATNWMNYESYIIGV